MHGMKFIQSFLLLSFLFTLSLWSATPVPYSGKIDIRGVNYFGEAQFAFSLHDGNGTTHWRNGNQPKETIKVTIRNGRYSVLLGGQGMNSLPPELFLNHDKLYLKVEFDNEDGEGLRHLAPDQLITATPRALVADIAKVAQRVGDGAITRDMLSSEVLSQLDANATASPSTPVTITRNMLPTSVLNDLNKSVIITRDMLPASVLNDLNKTVSITRDMLPQDVRDDLNKSSSSSSPITLSMLAPEVTAKLDQNSATEANTSTLVAFRVRKENNQTGLTNGNYSKVTWESSSIDHTNNFDLAQDAFIVPEDGLYAISSSARFSLVETGNFANLIIKRNNESINSGITIRAGGDSGVYISSVSAIVDANKSDILTIVGGQNGSTSPVTIINSSATYFEGFKIAGSYSNSIQPKSITKSMLGNDILSELNATIGMNRLSSEIRSKLDQNTTVADGSVTASKLANNTITTSQLNEQILKYLKPEITIQPQTLTIYADTNGSLSVTAEGKYLGYQWKKDGGNLTSETNSTLNITDANATQHDGNYSVVVSNDFGSVQSGGVEIRVSSLNDGLLAWWPFDGNGLDMSENGRHSTPTNTFSYTSGKINQAIRIVGLNGNTGGHILIPYISNIEGGDFSITLWVKEEQMHYFHGQYYIQFGSFASFGNTQGYTFGNSTDSTIQRNQWNHIAFVFGSSTKIGFLNGAIALSSSWDRPTSNSFTNSAIGKHWWENGQESATRITGQFDDVRIYDRALSAEEVQALYNLGQ